MKAKKYLLSVAALISLLMLMLISSCTRDEDDLEPATFPTTAEIFIDGFSGGLNYAAFGGSKVTAFQVDTEVKFDGEASMRYEVPDAGDPEGAFAGGLYFLEAGRDLSEYNVLTFWAKASKGATIDLLGFGLSPASSTYQVRLSNVEVNTNWTKYYIPIPDPSLLTEEKGMFYFSEGPEDGKGYTFWIDEVKFENLGTIAHGKFAILKGEEIEITAETGEKPVLDSLIATFNLPTGVDQTVGIAPSYFEYSSSNTSVAMVDAFGVVSVLDAGEAEITATLAGEAASGKLSIESLGEPVMPGDAAPTPDKDAANVTSLFSNAYTDVNVDFFNGYWQYSTTESFDLQVGDEDDIIRYRNLNFVGIQFTSPTIDITDRNHLHMDIWTPDPTEPASDFKILLVDLGADGSFGGDDDTSHEITITNPTLVTEDWISIDIPLTNFSGLTSRANLAQLVLSSGTISNVYVDNIYFYYEDVQVEVPLVAAPTPTHNASSVISLFSDAYTDVTVDTWRTDWSNAAFEDITIEGNATKKYSALDFVGIETVGSQVDATSMTHLHLDVWSGDFTQFSIKLVDFGADGAFDGGDDVEHQLDFATPNQNEWVSMDIPLSDFTNLTTRANIAQYILVGQPTGATTVYVDNMYFYDEAGGGSAEPTEAAPTPTQDAANVISLFSDAYTDVTVDTWRTDWSSAVFEDVTIAGNATKKYSTLDFVGIETVASQVDASGMTHIHFDVWSPDFTQVSLKLVDFGPDGAFGNDDTEHQLDFASPTQGQWVSMDIPLSDFTNLTTTGNMAQYIFTGQPVGTTTIFLDNIFFYNNDGGGGATEPTEAAPTPTQDAANVISLFSDAYSDVTVDTWRTDWSSAVFEDVTIAGNATKKYSTLDFVGIETVASQVDASGMTHIHFDVWSPDFTQVSLKLVDFGPDGAFGNDDTEHQLDFASPAQGQWVSMDIPLSDFTNLTTTGNMAQYIFVGQPTGTTTIFLDNIFFYNNDGGGSATEPTEAAPTPTQDAANVISLFSDAYSDVTVDTWRTDWSSAVFEDVTIAGNATKKYSTLDFVGIETVANQVDASGMTHIHFDVWSPDFTQVSLKLVDFGPDGAFGNDDTEHQLDFASPAQGQWVSMDILLSDFTNLTTTGNIAQYIFVGQPTGTTTIFLDNIFFYNNDGGGSATEPTVAAPTPTRAEADVISLFSDAYTDVTVDTWRTDWSSAVFEDVTIAGNATKKYSTLDFVGIETVANQVDASGMTHIHLDIWSPDFTQFGIKLVDFGPDGAFGNDDTEHQVDFATPNQGEWISLDIPLSDFVNLTTTSNMAQYILVGQPTGTTTIFVDNIYFYK